MKAKLIFAIIAVCVIVTNASEIKINITADPELPSPNILEKFENMDFESGFKSWNLSKAENTISIVKDSEKKSNVLKLTKSEKSIWRGLPLAPFTVGKTYIASCMIKPDSKISTKANPDSGLGFRVTFFSKDWKKGAGLVAKGAGTGKWQKTVSKPFTIPDWAHFCQMSVAISYSPGTGLVDDLCINEAYSQMKIDVTAPENIRQVKVMDNTGKTVFDSGILQNSAKIFQKDIRVETPYTYTIMVITSDGDVKTANYPQSIKSE